MWAGAEPSLVSTVTASDRAGREIRAGGPLVEALDAGPEHVDPSERMQRQVLDPERAEHPGRPVDRGGDVEELQVEEDLVAEVAQRSDGIGAGRAVQLEADLDDAEPRPERRRQAMGLDQVVEVEGEREPAPDVVGDGSVVTAVAPASDMGCSDQLADLAYSMSTAPCSQTVEHP